MVTLYTKLFFIFVSYDLYGSYEVRKGYSKKQPHFGPWTESSAAAKPNSLIVTVQSKTTYRTKHKSSVPPT